LLNFFSAKRRHLNARSTPENRCDETSLKQLLYFYRSMTNSDNVGAV